jgi:hypothetical protein
MGRHEAARQEPAEDGPDLSRGPGRARWGRRGPTRLGLLVLVGLTVSSCAFVDVLRLASDETGGRQNGTPGSALAQEHIVDELSRISRPLPGQPAGDAGFRHPITGGTNIIGLIPGTDLADEYVVVGAHYDHIGTNCRSADPDDDICNGATDNAAGVAAMLEVGRELAGLPHGPRRSIVLAAWDREEDGLLGAADFVTDPPVPLTDVVAYVNFDILGANLLPSLRQVSFALGAESGGEVLEGIVQDAASTGPVDVAHLSAIFGQGRSDYQVFLSRRVPTVFFTDSTGPCYHTAQDEIGVVDFRKLSHQIRTAEETVTRLAEVDTPPTFVSTPLVTYEDAVALLEVVEKGQEDLDRFTQAQQDFFQGFRDDLTSIVEAGPAAFGSDDVNAILGGAVQTVSLLTTGECDGFLTPGRP